MADKFCAVSFLQISAPEMDDRMLTELLDTDNGLLVSLHIRSMDQNEAIKTVKRKITDIDSMKIDAQKKAVREGFDMDIIPTDLATYAGEAKNILRDLQSRNERMFLEDDYGMIDGVINNGRRGEELEKAQEYAERTTPEKSSIRERLEDAKRECAEHKPQEVKKPGRDVPEHDCL